METSVLTLCERCGASPQGIDGHWTLHTQVQPLPDDRKSRVTFRCAACGAQWSRKYVGGGEFAWDLESR